MPYDGDPLTWFGHGQKLGDRADRGADLLHDFTAQGRFKVRVVWFDASAKGLVVKGPLAILDAGTPDDRRRAEPRNVAPDFMLAKIAVRPREEHGLQLGTCKTQTSSWCSRDKRDDGAWSRASRTMNPPPGGGRSRVGGFRAQLRVAAQSIGDPELAFTSRQRSIRSPRGTSVVLTMSLTARAAPCRVERASSEQSRTEPADCGRAQAPSTTIPATPWAGKPMAQTHAQRR